MQVIEALQFADWLAGLKDMLARRAIVRRLTRLAATGQFGDCAPVGDDVSEMRLHVGPGYRLYYTIRGGTVILWGGNKGSQQRDIAKAKAMAAELEWPGT